MAEPSHRIRRQRKPQNEVRHTTFGTRLRAEMQDYLVAQATSNGRSLGEEIEDRLETSRGADIAWGGPRVVALLRTLAAIAAEHRGWLDDHAAFNLVRDKWLEALKELEPPLPVDVERRIAKYRTDFDKLEDQNLPLATLDHLARLGQSIASQDHQLPQEMCTEFALKGLEAAARARVLAARAGSSRHLGQALSLSKKQRQQGGG
ncbi:MAG: hypothetical protein J2P48_02210 [Alphaproteobacteria bacterium]|nr:hypothetical protein [Alphaproteobacteria bacterium]